MSDSTEVAVKRYPEAVEQQDRLAVEEPLELVLRFNSNGSVKEQTAAITMRTPGADFDLARGFLFTEGVVSKPGDVVDVSYRGDESNAVVVTLDTAVEVDLGGLERHFYTTSSCGVCGKTAIEALSAAAPFSIDQGFLLQADELLKMPAATAAAQSAFGQTGSTHAAALFNAVGELQYLAEDVGRHNALDKLIGHALQEGLLPLADSVIFLTGRAGFELVQKARMAACPLVAAVGAPSSLAVDSAWEAGMTLVGFLRDGRFNVYSCPNRIEA